MKTAYPYFTVALLPFAALDMNPILGESGRQLTLDRPATLAVSKRF
jgi:hypothetical protein